MYNQTSPMFGDTCYLLALIVPNDDESSLLINVILKASRIATFPSTIFLLANHYIQPDIQLKIIFEF